VTQNQWTEQMKVEGQHLVEEVKKLYNEGNVRHLVITHEGHTILEIPVVLGVAAAVLAPTLAAVAAVGALLTHCTIDVVRTDGLP
jgi:Domain of unknown function (DUF4342)